MRRVHSIQAVTAKDEVLFCQVQRSQQYYAHIVLDVEWSYYDKEPKY